LGANDPELGRSWKRTFVKKKKKKKKEVFCGIKQRPKTNPRGAKRAAERKKACMEAEMGEVYKGGVKNRADFFTRVTGIW